MKNIVADIAPAILCLYPGLDPGQLDIISHLDGPVLGIAGPGSGKTLVVALRGANILLLNVARPEELVLCTYNRAAARELRERFTAVATAAGYVGRPLPGPHRHHPLPVPVPAAGRSPAGGAATRLRRHQRG